MVGQFEMELVGEKLASARKQAQMASQQSNSPMLVLPQANEYQSAESLK